VVDAGFRNHPQYISHLYLGTLKKMVHGYLEGLGIFTHENFHSQSANLDHSKDGKYQLPPVNQWIDLREDLQESPIFNGKIYGFL